MNISRGGGASMGDSQGGVRDAERLSRTLTERPSLSLRPFRHRVGTDIRFQTLLAVASRPGLVGKRASLTSRNLDKDRGFSDPWYAPQEPEVGRRGPSESQSGLRRGEMPPTSPFTRE